RLKREGGRPVTQAFRPVADRTVRRVERAAGRDRRGVVRGRVLQEPHEEGHWRRRDVRRDGVREPEVDEDEDADEAGALREAPPVASAAPRDDGEDREERRADGE